MNIRIDVFHHQASADEPPRWAKEILRRLGILGTALMTDLSKISAAVAANADVEKSAVTLLEGLKAALDAAGTDPAALQALSDSLGAQTSDLAAAVAANTPAAPTE